MDQRKADKTMRLANSFNEGVNSFREGAIAMPKKSERKGIFEGGNKMDDCGNLEYGKEAKKETNPKDALGVAKVPMHCVSARVMMELGLAMMEGGRKYGTHNYRAMGVRVSVYYDAVMRHMMDYWEGQDTDPDSGVHHVVKAIATLVVLRDSMLMQNCEDDRPIRLPNGLNIADLNEQAAKLIEKYPVSKEPFTEAGLEKKEVKHEKSKEYIAAGNRAYAKHNADGVCECEFCEARRVKPDV